MSAGELSETDSQGGELLRALGITPAVDAVDAYEQILGAGPWPDADDRRARRSG